MRARADLQGVLDHAPNGAAVLGKVEGLLSIDDVVELLAEEVAAVGTLLRKEAPGIALR